MLPTPHPLLIRITHWLNALAVIIMVASGWRIYNASPLFGFTFPEQLTIGGWLGGALQWHFAAMWLLVINGMVYLAYNLFSGRLRHKLLPIQPHAILTDLRATLTLHLSHTDLNTYNTLQKLAYLGVTLALIVVVMSGLVVWKHVQFPLLNTLMGGYSGARLVHFSAMAAIVAFVGVHLIMVLLVPRTISAMVGMFRVKS